MVLNSIDLVPQSCEEHDRHMSLGLALKGLFPSGFHSKIDKFKAHQGLCHKERHR